MKVEAIFGGVLALFVIAVAAIAVVKLPAGSRAAASAAGEGVTQVEKAIAKLDEKSETSVACQCYDAGYALAGSNVDVLSSQYRTGYEQCRAIGATDGAEAWTAGWNARISAKPFEASCRSYMRKQAKR